jgi:hypothetical protein
MEALQLIENLKRQGFIHKPKPIFDGGVERLSQDLLQLFSKYFSSQYVKLNFEIPLDFLTFLECAKGSFVLDNYYYLLHIEGVLSVTEFFLKEWNPNDDNSLWINIGGYSEKHEYLMCCDKSKPEFGKISETWDDHPWMDGEQVFLKRHGTEWNNLGEYSLSE